MHLISERLVARVVETGMFFCRKCSKYSAHERIEQRPWRYAFGIRLFPVKKPRQRVMCVSCQYEGTPHIPLDPRYWDALNRQQFTETALRVLIKVARADERVLPPGGWGPVREAYQNVCGESLGDLALANANRSGSWRKSVPELFEFRSLKLDRKSKRRLIKGAEDVAREYRSNREAEQVVRQLRSVLHNR